MIEYAGEGRFILGRMDERLKVTSLAVLDRDTGLPVWWLVDDRISDEWWDVADIRVLEVLPTRASNPVAGSRGTNSGRELHEFELGQVPQGFRQVVPDSRRTPVVTPGKSYTMVVIGTQWGSVEFVA